ncbi:hypothetical protein AOLI_G00153690 [Acnodon oligacanthus]
MRKLRQAPPSRPFGQYRCPSLTHSELRVIREADGHERHEGRTRVLSSTAQGPSSSRLRCVRTESCSASPSSFRYQLGHPDRM